ncbi:hypothetical protein EMIT053CA3_260019 [Pseudomonas donghuensis]
MKPSQQSKAAERLAKGSRPSILSRLTLLAVKPDPRSELIRTITESLHDAVHAAAGVRAYPTSTFPPDRSCQRPRPCRRRPVEPGRLLR